MMTVLNADAMRRAMAEMRAGRLTDATAAIQRALGAGAPTPPTGAYPGRSVALPGLPRTDRPAPRETFTCRAGTRDYVVYAPAELSRPRGLILMLHGCTQTPEDFAAGTGMNALADRHDLILIYPAQSRGANAQTCWSWFSPGDQRRDRGEPAILAAMTRQIAERHAVPRERVFVAGLSAGAAMAIILGRTHGDVYGAVGAHSGLPYGAARTVAEAFTVMRDPAKRHLVQPGRPTRTIAFHGSADATVNPGNSDLVIRDALDGATGPVIRTESAAHIGGRRCRRIESGLATGPATSEHWVVDGLGHAWSGGQPAGSYADPAGPDASAEMVRFFLAPFADEV